MRVPPLCTVIRQDFDPLIERVEADFKFVVGMEAGVIADVSTERQCAKRRIQLPYLSGRRLIK